MHNEPSPSPTQPTTTRKRKFDHEHSSDKDGTIQWISTDCPDKDDSCENSVRHGYIQVQDEPSLLPDYLFVQKSFSEADFEPTDERLLRAVADDNDDFRTKCTAYYTSNGLGLSLTYAPHGV